MLDKDQQKGGCGDTWLIYNDLYMYTVYIYNINVIDTCL